MVRHKTSLLTLFVGVVLASCHARSAPKLKSNYTEPCSDGYGNYENLGCVHFADVELDWFEALYYCNDVMDGVLVSPENKT